MKRSRNPTAFFVVVFVAATYASAIAIAGVQNDEVKEIQSLLVKQQGDWNRGDLDAFLTGYWNSPKLVFLSGGDRTQGFETVRERYRRRYKSEGKAMGQLTFSDIEVEGLGPDVALARGRWRLAMPDESKPGGLFTLILRKFPDGWKVIHDHTSVEAGK